MAADEPPKGLEYFLESFYIWQKSNDLPGQAIALTNLGYAYYLLGRYREAVEFAERALEITRRVGTRRTQAAVICNLVAYYIYLDPVKADAYGTEAVALATEIKDYETVAGSHINVGELERCRGRWDAAREHVAAAEFEWVMRQTEKTDCLHWPQGAFGLARTYVAQGRREEALEHVELAEKAFRDHEWLYWADRLARFRTEAAL